MSHECNLPKTINVSEGVDIVTELVEKTDDFRSKFKAICLNYNLKRDRYNFVDEVYLFASIPSNAKNNEIGSEITLDLPIKKVYRPLAAGFSHPDRDILIKIIVECDCEYTRNGKTLQKSQYEIPMNGRTLNMQDL